MKEIKYDGDLEEDIENLKLDPWTKKKFKYYFLNHLAWEYFTTFVMLIFCFSIKLPNLLSIDIDEIIFSGWFSFFASGISSYIMTKKDKKNYEMERAVSFSNITKLSTKLNNDKEVNINMWHNHIKETIVKEEREVIKDRLDDTDKDKKKIVKYFYLLDKQDQIQVLKQIQTKIKNSDDKLYLLDETDKENIKMPEKTMKLEFK